MKYNKKKALYENIIADVSKVVKKCINENSLANQKQHWQIQYGLTDNDSERVDVICSEDDLPIICAALTRYDEKVRNRPIACTAYKGGGASFRRTPDYQYCDCM